MDAQTIAVNALKGATRMFLTDLEALPDEAYGQDFGGKARKIPDFVYESILVNDHVCMKLRGEEPFEWPEEMWIKAPPELATKEQVIEAFKASSNKMIATAEALSPDEMATPFDDGDGSITTPFERCRFMASHLWYHSGQLNFIQTMLGDDGWHWN